MIENRKLSRKEISKTNGVKVQSCSKINNVNGNRSTRCERFGRSILKICII